MSNIKTSVLEKALVYSYSNLNCVCAAAHNNTTTPEHNAFWRIACWVSAPNLCSKYWRLSVALYSLHWPQRVQYKEAPHVAADVWLTSICDFCSWCVHLFICRSSFLTNGQTLERKSPFINSESQVGLFAYRWANNEWHLCTEKEKDFLFFFTHKPRFLRRPIRNKDCILTSLQDTSLYYSQLKPVLSSISHLCTRHSY